MLETTHVVTNTVLKIIKWAAIFFKCSKMIVSVCVCVGVTYVCVCVYVCVCPCIYIYTQVSLSVL